MGTLTAEGLASRLADHLRAHGWLTDPRWATALQEVPRHLFVPQTAWFVANHADAPRGRFSKADTPVAYMEAVYSDTSVILQTDDGAGDPLSGQGLFSSSVSAPAVVFPFLELLSPRRGDRILDVGTGSGWTAALLSWVAGAEGVTSIEVDGQVSAQAAVNLGAAGFNPQLIVGDGVTGWPDGAPFDRVHVTAGVSHIPMAWIEQTRPGGVVVMPWHVSGRGGHKLRLTVVDDATAVGSLHGRASYMMLRGQRHNTRWDSHGHEAAARSTTKIHPRTIAEVDLGAELMVAALAPRVGWYDISDNDGYSLLMYELDDHDGTGSWAACDYAAGAPEFQVTQYGRRRLWDELSDAYRQWVTLGSPTYDRFGVTVDPGGTWLWLDHPITPSWKCSAPDAPDPVDTRPDDDGTTGEEGRWRPSSRRDSG